MLSCCRRGAYTKHRTANLRQKAEHKGCRHVSPKCPTVMCTWQGSRSGMPDESGMI